MLFAGYLIKARLDAKIVNADFVWFFLQSRQYWEYISSEQIQSTIQNVNAEKYGDLQIPLPPLLEQKAICLILGTEAVNFDNLISNAALAIELLQERRSALISAAVTGKIDVRNYTPKEAA